MTHTKGNVVQYNACLPPACRSGRKHWRRQEYYHPFGMQTANSWTRENTTGNQFLYNRGTELNNTTQVYDLFYRNYDPVLGRMNQIDRMASKYASLTPYNYSFNDPVFFSDPLGDDPQSDCTYCIWFHNGAAQQKRDEPIMDPGGGGYAGGYGGGGGAITRSGNTFTIYWNRIGPYGGTWHYKSGYRNFRRGEEALVFGNNYNNCFNSWQYTKYKSEAGTEFAYTWAKATGSLPVEATVDYWLNRRREILSQTVVQLIASLKGDPSDDIDVLGILKKSMFLALRVALHLPDAVSYAGNVNMLAGFGFDLTIPGLTWLMVLTGKDAGQTVSFDDYAKGFGYDDSAGISMTELYWIPKTVSSPELSDFQGRRYSVSLGFGWASLDFSKGATFAQSMNGEITRGYVLGINSFFGVGDPGPSFNYNYADTVLNGKN